MKTTLFLMLLFVCLGSSAAELRIEPAYLNDGVYDVDIDATGQQRSLQRERRRPCRHPNPGFGVGPLHTERPNRSSLHVQQSNSQLPSVPGLDNV
jgi:hypothetical protein